MGVLSMVQIAGLALAAMLMASLLPTSGPAVFALPLPGALARHLARQLAIRPAHVALLGAAALGALTVWTFPSWIAAQLLPLMPEGTTSSLELLTRLLQTAAPGGKAVLLLAIVVSAPLFEEVIFRGYLWSAISRAAPQWVALVLTTVLFAMYHVDPVHIVALLPTALFLGWLRLMSGSLWPSIVAHFVNNAVAAVTTLIPAASELDAIPLPLALAGAAFTVGSGTLGWLLARRAVSEEDPR
jgi:membrane protease YdiL (CAAX protease family)